MPASPLMTTTRGRPSSKAATAAANLADSGSRPTSRVLERLAPVATAMRA
jgi:hypothetical protein